MSTQFREKKRHSHDWKSLECDFGDVVKRYIEQHYTNIQEWALLDMSPAFEMVQTSPTFAERFEWSARMLQGRSFFVLHGPATDTSKLSSMINSHSKNVHSDGFSFTTTLYTIQGKALHCRFDFKPLEHSHLNFMLLILKETTSFDDAMQPESTSAQASRVSHDHCGRKSGIIATISSGAANAADCLMRCFLVRTFLVAPVFAFLDMLFGVTMFEFWFCSRDHVVDFEPCMPERRERRLSAGLRRLSSIMIMVFHALFLFLQFISVDDDELELHQSPPRAYNLARRRSTMSSGSQRIIQPHFSNSFRVKRLSI